MSELLGREAILAAFEKLDSELSRRKVRADLFVVGGAAIALAYMNERRTRGVDAVFDNRGRFMRRPALWPAGFDFRTTG